MQWGLMHEDEWLQNTKGDKLVGMLGQWDTETSE